MGCCMRWSWNHRSKKVSHGWSVFQEDEFEFSETSDKTELNKLYPPGSLHPPQHFLHGLYKLWTWMCLCFLYLFFVCTDYQLTWVLSWLLPDLFDCLPLSCPRSLMCTLRDLYAATGKHARFHHSRQATPSPVSSLSTRLSVWLIAHHTVAQCRFLQRKTTLLCLILLLSEDNPLRFQGPPVLEQQERSLLSHPQWRPLLRVCPLYGWHSATMVARKWSSYRSQILCFLCVSLPCVYGCTQSRKKGVINEVREVPWRGSRGRAPCGGEGAATPEILDILSWRDQKFNGLWNVAAFLAHICATRGPNRTNK